MNKFSFSTQHVIKYIKSPPKRKNVSLLGLKHFWEKSTSYQKN